MVRFLFVLLLVPSLLRAVSFNGLSKDPVVLEYVADVEGYKSVSLLVANKNKTHTEIPVKLTYLLGNDTLVDYLVIGEGFRKDVKTLSLMAGDSLKVLLQLQNPDSIEVKKVKGSLALKDPYLLQMNALPYKKDFVGNYWDAELNTIFKVEKSDTLGQILKFRFNLNENYAFDKLYFQLNVIAPDSTFSSLEGYIEVTDSGYVEFKPRAIYAIEQIGLYEVGTYIIELVPLMGIRRINGINSIEYEMAQP